MSEIKISLGIDIEENSKAKIQDIIDEINAKKPEITVKVNTEQALKDIKTLQKELKKLKDINIKINTKTNQSGTRNKNTNTNANESVTKNLPSTNVNKVSWKKVADADGYQIYRSATKNGKYKRIKTSSKASTTYTSVKLKKGKTYYYKMRAYKVVNGKKIYSSFTAPKKAKVK